MPDLRTVVVGKKEFALDLHQHIAEPFVVCCAESDIFVIILGFVIRWIQLEDGVRAVILLYELLEVLVFNHHAL